MKKIFITSIIVLGIGATQAIVPVLHAEEPAAKSTNEETEKDWLDTLNMRIGLAQAKVATLRAKVALGIEKSNDRAKQDLDDAEAWYARAKDAAKSKASKEIGELVDNTIAAKNAITDAPDKAKKKIDELVEQTEDSLEEYGQVTLNTDEAKLLKKRYALLEVEAALLKARIAEKADDTGKLTTSYLDEAKNWYAKAKSNTSKKWHQELADLSADIDDAKKTLIHKRDQAADAITDLAERASELVRGTNSPK
jgi:YesN/AraC family two-component response regulator